MLRFVIAVAVSSFVFACKPLPPEVPSTLGVPAAPLAEAFRRPVAATLTPLVTGEIQVDRSLLLDLKNPALADATDAKVWVPVLAWLYQHPTRGAWLIDSGFDASFAESGHGNFQGLAVLADFARQPKGHDVAALVRQAGVEPSALKGVLMTHLHSDHTAGLPALPGVEVFAGAGALAGFESDVVATVTHLDAVPRINTFDLSVGTPSVAGNTLDVFGDGALLAVDTAGHTAGHLSFIVNLEGGPVLLTGDASHSQVGFEAGVAPGKVADRAGADATLARLRAFAAAFPSARVYFGHEAGQHDVGAGAQAPLR